MACFTANFPKKLYESLQDTAPDEAWFHLNNQRDDTVRLLYRKIIMTESSSYQGLSRG